MGREFMGLIRSTFLVSKEHLSKYWDNFNKTCLVRNDPFEKHINEIFTKEICISPLKSLAVHITNINSSFGLSPYLLSFPRHFIGGEKTHLYAPLFKNLPPF